MSAKKARYCIGELSTLCNIPQKTLRYYDEIGLFTPDYRDDSTHYRYYSKSQIVNLMIIKTLKQMGFPLKDIRQIISENDAQSLEANINSHLETMRDDIMKRIDQYTECSYLLQKIQNGIDILEASSSLPSEDLAISIEHIPKISLMYDRSEMEGYDYSEMSLDRWISILRKAEHSKHKIMGEIVDIDWRVVELHPWHLWDFLFSKERMEINYHSIHYIDCIRSFVGDPTSVYCKTMQHPKMRDLAQTRTAIIMDYGKDLRVNLHINHNHDYAKDYQESMLKIEGMKGAIRVRLGLILDYPEGRPDKVEYILDDGEGWRELKVRGSWFPEAFIGTMGGLMKKLENPDYDYMNSVEDAYHTMCVVESCYKSSAEGGTPVEY